MSNPRCFFDISLEGELLGRVIFELFADAVPKTAENFMVQGGDFTLRNGKGGQSIYGATFEDEDLRREIDSEGLLVMANRGKNTNGSQFFVSLRPCPHLLGKHVVFGRVVKGYEVIEAISKLPVNEKDHPLQLVTISHCGQLERKAGRNSHKRRARSPSSSPELSPEQIEALKAQALKEEEDERMKKEARLRELKELKMRVEREGQRGQTRRGDGRGMGDWRDESVGNGEGSRHGGVLYKGRGKMSAPSEGSRRSTGMLGWDD
ncbi:BZ3500_MvSof-1268-A1-R1_Chr3-2g06331 [Microbotryum saponariae]|uniref:Peptidyl-prolyl cis-trans isomerase n=1 Tax=Microbotryum saponariae TaxID=289078 RepID=A0A2X0NA83_9BASI|nr:BZ3500_MvSof-1268-A1-R1_Chr3-2g06331 [Microbotryum saponariae]SDA04302.1 BZ3501_MvSof-1269-A2-R1_Chr3-2g06022 [Microbotryum saponariae]